MQLSSRILSLEESATLAITKRVRALKQQGRDILGLTLGEPDFDTPTHISEAAKAAIDAGHTHYPPVSGIAELREAISQKFQRENNIPYQPKHIVVSTGAKQSLYNVAMAILNPGDEVVLVAPYWVSYSAMVHLAQGKSKVLQTRVQDDYKISPQALDEALTHKSRLLFLNSPSNPTGSVYSKAEWMALIEVLLKYPNLYIISDEIYEHIVYDQTHFSPASVPELFERIITVNGFSKGFAMTGWRLGYIGAPQEVAYLCEKVQGQCTSGANTIAQWAAVAALNESLSPTLGMRDAFRKRRDALYPRLQQIEGLEVSLPEGAFYFYPSIEAFIGKRTPAGDLIQSVDDFCLYLIEEGGLAVVPGTAFGTQHHIRMSYAYSIDILEEAMNRLESALGELKG